LAEAQALAAMAATDKLLEALTALQDIQMRLTRLELYAQQVAPEYERITRRQALREGAG
jgi:hypothetical protein